MRPMKAYLRSAKQRQAYASAFLEAAAMIHGQMPRSQRASKAVRASHRAKAAYVGVGSFASWLTSGNSGPSSAMPHSDHIPGRSEMARWGRSELEALVTQLSASGAHP